MLGYSNKHMNVENSFLVTERPENENTEISVKEAQSWKISSLRFCN